MDKKALFFDIDGTLFSEIDRRVPESAVLALERARTLGHLVFINTGRTYCQTRDIRGEVDADGYLCGCGTYILCGTEVLYDSFLPEADRLRIKRELLRCNLEGVLEGTDSCSIPACKLRSSWLENLRGFFREEGVLAPDGFNEDSFEFSKFCFVDDGQGDRETFVRSLSQFEVIDRGNGFYECVPQGHSKATAIELILKKYGVPYENAWVFGDSMNDLAMFQYASNAVLMGKHDAGLEPYATFVTRTVEEDGIYYALEHFGML